MGFVLLPGAMGHLRSGKLRALAVTTEERMSAMPDLPTMSQAGVRDLVLFDWSGLFAPAGTPKDAIAKLGAEVRKVAQSPQMRQRSLEQGFEPKALSADEMAALMKTDTEKWARIVKQTGIRLD
jgi:tripartite-type tricarboxylate transporter receptor subunit TctC